MVLDHAGVTNLEAMQQLLASARGASWARGRAAGGAGAGADAPIRDPALFQARAFTRESWLGWSWGQRAGYRAGLPCPD